MSPIEAVRSVLREYVGFSGRARRSEYWWFVLFELVVTALALALDAALFGTAETTTTATSAAFRVDAGPVTLVVGLALLLPGLAVAVRRLHDTDRRGWWLFLGLVPLVGPIVLLVFFVMDSTAGENRFGPAPKQLVPSEPVG